MKINYIYVIILLLLVITGFVVYNSTRKCKDICIGKTTENFSGKKYLLICAGQSNAVGQNGTDKSNIIDGIDTNDDPRLKMIFANSNIYNPKKQKIEITKDNNLVGKAVIASCPIQVFPKNKVDSRKDRNGYIWENFINKYSVSWPFHAGKELLNYIGKNDEIYILVVAWGSSGFILNSPFFDDPSIVWKKKKNKETLQTILIRRVKQTIKHYDTIPIAFLWHQGEADAIGNNKEYQSQLEELISNLRNKIKYPNLPFITGRMTMFPEIDGIPKENWDNVDCIHKLFSKNPDLRCDKSKSVKIKNTNCIHHNVQVFDNNNTYTINDLRKLYVPGDKIHYNSQGHRVLGKMYIEALKEINNLDIYKNETKH